MKVNRFPHPISASHLPEGQNHRADGCLSTSAQEGAWSWILCSVRRGGTQATEVPDFPCIQGSRKPPLSVHNPGNLVALGASFFPRELQTRSSAPSWACHSEPFHTIPFHLYLSPDLSFLLNNYFYCSLGDRVSSIPGWSQIHYVKSTM